MNDHPSLTYMLTASFLCGGVAFELLRIAATRAGESWRHIHRTPPTPPVDRRQMLDRLESWLSDKPNPAPRTAAVTFHPDPRGEALAILQICDWDFTRAFNMTDEMIGQDVDNRDFWHRVRGCIEIFQAGREDVAA